MLKDSIRTTAPHGITHHEIKRLSGAVFYIKKYCRGKRSVRPYWAVIGDEVLNQSASQAHKTFSQIKSRLVRLQERGGLLQYWTDTKEITGGLHDNLVFPATAKMVECLKAGFPEVFQGEKSIQKISNNFDVVSYIAKERTQQAQHLPGPRKKGPHRYTGLGDRVTLSQALKHEVVTKGIVEDWKPTNSKRTASERTYAPRMKPTQYMKPAGQLFLFPELENSPARFRDYYGGTASPSVALEIEHYRKFNNLTQSQLGQKIGLSQPQIANVIHGRFGMSHGAAMRLHEVLAA